MSFARTRYPRPLFTLSSCSFQYLTPRIRITPKDLVDSPLRRPTTLHFICSPSRALAITSEVHEDPDWNPVAIYEPIPVRTA